ncbi:hypothetical protein VHEMI07325 [[Torrubiella] hemipterigena]|uniref:RING finger domain-containing protein n=1 Tax=[Torrubiella] hemipterigena TaxID=1531966 RepID=A0A0A1TLH4_9HYPO|nr:hypothetical protein VHEMI07325 [[Torrubiella] hemipterigena]
MSSLPHDAPPHGDEAPPPYSENDIYSTSGAAQSIAGSANSRGDESLGTSEIIYTPPATPGGFAETNNQGATQYIDSRPVPANIPGGTTVKLITLTEESIADDFAYDHSLASRDVNSQDWATFINFLLPDHTTRGNDVILDRKLREEAQSEAASSSGRSEAATAHLEGLRERGFRLSPEELAHQRTVARGTVQQWNRGFFGPRGIEIRVNIQDGPPSDMPGSWNPAFSEPPQTASRATQPTAAAAARQAFNVGGLVMDSEGIRWGNSVTMDSNGIRVGNLVMDSKGIRMGGASGGSSAVPGPDARGLPNQGHMHHGHPSERGRGHMPGGFPQRRRSLSASSVSSSSSESSVGSLPDYDDVKEAQMPVYLSILQDLTANPEKIRSRGDLNHARAAIKAAKANPVNPALNKATLKAQIKGLHQVWKKIKKDQKRLQREERRVRRKQRKGERREYRKNKREMKKAIKTNPWAYLAQATGQPPMPPGAPGAPPPPMPPMPGQFPVHPPHPHHPFHQHHQHQDRCGMGRSRGRGLFQPGPSGMPGPSCPPGPWGRGRHQFPTRGGFPFADTRGAPGPGPDPESVASMAREQAAASLRSEIEKQQKVADSLEDGPHKRGIEKAIEAMTESLSSLQVDGDHTPNYHQ